MIAIVLLSLILILVLFIKVKTTRVRFSLIIGFLASILSFFAFLLIFFFPARTILWSLLCVFFVSIIVFLILWNKIQTKRVYFLLFIPVVSIAIGVTVIRYHNSILKIPTVNEQFYNLYNFRPFVKNNLLANLDEDIDFEIIYNLPILDGATALYPVYASFVQAVYPEREYDISTGPVFCNKTDEAFINLFEGKVDLIFCAEPSENQLEVFHENNIVLKLVPIGKEAFVFFVNSENPINNLSIDNIHRIYSGRIRNWKELGGLRQKIRAFQRPKNSGSQTMLEKIMDGIPIIKPRRENVPHGMGDIISQVAEYRNFSNAIGYSFLYFSTVMVKNEQIKLLSIDGIYPSLTTIQDNSYPFSDCFYAIYIEKKEKNENIEPLIEWILSRQGQSLISMTGYIPIKTE